ncbi:MAG: uroporphyrinogen-III C-methyltransferase [Chloroflexi bacterium]|nr:uroporphyrinogen-III C-methyltransferase [Chloroflexota bacterium]
MNKKGRVSLVGAGPGDPGLITVKALDRIKEADVIVYDRLVNPVLLDHATAECETIFVGKGPGRHTLGQDEINQLLVARARAGKQVVRLKGGDPFVFGRGGEEAMALVKAGVAFEVVPGISSATAVPAYAGIPVTHRGYSSSVTIVTGHEDPEKEESSIDWHRLARAGDTIVLLMGIGNLTTIAEQIIAGGRAPDTPVALVRWGTTARQQTLEGTLSNIGGLAKQEGFSPPVVAVIGEVAGLRSELNWYEAGPLFGKTVLVTRSRKQASALSARLAREGADVIELPAIEIHQSPENVAALDRAIDSIDDYSWIVFTSVNGVEAFFDRLRAKGLDISALNGAKTCAIGSATARAIEDRGARVHLVPKKYVAEAVLEEFEGMDIRGARFLLPRAEGSRPLLVEGLKARGALVDEAPAYSALLPAQTAPRALKRLTDGEVDIATFASSSTVRNLVRILDGDLGPLGGVCIACIGPVTAATAEEVGLKVDVVASDHTIPGLVEELVRHVRSR